MRLFMRPYTPLQPLPLINTSDRSSTVVQKVLVSLVIWVLAPGCVQKHSRTLSSCLAQCNPCRFLSAANPHQFYTYSWYNWLFVGAHYPSGRTTARILETTANLWAVLCPRNAPPVQGFWFMCTSGAKGVQCAV
jgi:hypothetical protein